MIKCHAPLSTCNTCNKTRLYSDHDNSTICLFNFLFISMCTLTLFSYNFTTASNY